MTVHAIRGHEMERRALASAHARGRLPAALLIHGARGIGKQRLALWLTQLIVCEDPDGAPCEACAPCRMARSFEHPDIHWYFPLPRPKSASKERMTDALEEARIRELAKRRDEPRYRSHTDDVRGLYLAAVRSLRSRAHKKSVTAEGPLFIVGDAELLVSQEASAEAANALLKLLEEPPGRSRFILTSSAPGRLLPTIRSRTVPLHLTPLPTNEVAGFLEHDAGFEAGAAAWAAALAQGSPGRALGFLPDEDEATPLADLRDRAFAIVSAATGSGAAATYSLVLSFPPAGARGLLDLFEFVEAWLRDLAAVAAEAPDVVLNRDRLSDLEDRVAKSELTPYRVARAFALVDRARMLARGNVNPQLVINGLITELRGILSADPTRDVA